MRAETPPFYPDQTCYCPHTLNRRNFLRAAVLGPLLLPLLAGCSANTESKKDEGRIWSKEEVLALASEMQKDNRFPDIAEAGKILAGNQLGEPTLSQMCSFFTDDPIKIRTLPERLAHFEPGKAPVDGYIKRNPPKVELILKAKGSRPDFKDQVSSSMSLETINVTSELEEQQADFINKFSVASMIYHPKALDTMTKMIMLDIDNIEYMLPTDEKRKNLLRMSFVNWKSANGISVSDRVSFWAQFLLIPDYFQGQDLGLIPAEKRMSLMEITRAKLEQISKVLAKDEKGRYRFIGNQNIINNAMLAACDDAYINLVKPGYNKPKAPGNQI